MLNTFSFLYISSIKVSKHPPQLCLVPGVVPEPPCQVAQADPSPAHPGRVASLQTRTPFGKLVVRRAPFPAHAALGDAHCRQPLCGGLLSLLRRPASPLLGQAHAGVNTTHLLLCVVLLNFFRCVGGNRDGGRGQER